MKDADMSQNVFAAGRTNSEQTTAMASIDDKTMAQGPPRPFHMDLCCTTKPPLRKPSNIEMWCERLASRGQRLATILVKERVARESTPGVANSRALSVSDGASTFELDAQDLCRLEIPMALVPHLLSKAGTSPSRTPSPHSQ